VLAIINFRNLRKLKEMASCITLSIYVVPNPGKLREIRIKRRLK